MRAAKPHQKLKLALVGPVQPMRGGIAQYTTQLHEALKNDCQLLTVSFKRLYPKRLYPGENYEEATATRLKDVEYIIDAYNPLSLHKASRLIVKQGCNVVIISWWTLFWQPGLALMARRLRRKGVKVIFLCHNLVDHESSGLKNSISKALLKTADGYVVHAKSQMKSLELINPHAKILQRQHPIYTRFSKTAAKPKRRGRLELLFFGIIRPYKGLEVLVESLAQLNDKKIYLTVAGEPWGNAQLHQKLLAFNAPNIELHLNYIKDEDVGKFFNRADVVVLPYKSATGSGVATVAYNYQKPILATKVGGLQDVVVQNKTGWLVEPNSPTELATAITKIDRRNLQKMKPHIQRFCKENSWQAMAKAIVEFSESLVEEKPNSEKSS